MFCAEWAPAGPTVCTGRSSKNQKQKGPQKESRPGVKGPACERTASNLVCPSKTHFKKKQKKEKTIEGDNKFYLFIRFPSFLFIFFAPKGIISCASLYYMSRIVRGFFPFARSTDCFLSVFSRLLKARPRALNYKNSYSS